MSLRALALLLFAGAASGQSADQQVVSAIDSPDPVIPGQNITYTITMRNNGPDPATNGGLNVNLGGALTHVSSTAPAGFSCAAFGNNLSCTHPSFAAGTNAVFTIVANVPESLLNFPDGSITSNFFTSGVTPDPNSGNNAASVVTNYDSPQVDIALVATDSPDPVGPDQNISYSITVTNAGPDSAQSVNFNMFNNGTLRFQSATAPAGFNCTLPAVNGVPTFTCSTPTLAPGSYAFGVVVRADDDVLGINDGTVSVVFSAGGIGDDTNDNNNSQTVSTAYVTPDADVAIAVDDFPDPARLGDSFEYLVTMTNSGPDAATQARMNVFNSGTLDFESIEAPAGFSCVPPAIGAAPTFTCTHASLAVGATAEFILTVRSDAAVLGPNGGTVSTVFSAGSAHVDPDNTDNVETEATLVRPDGLFKDGFEG
jgi:uncharacterized protein